MQAFRMILVSVSVIILFLTDTGIYAQKAATLHKLTGAVADEATGKPLPGITVVAVSKNGNKNLAGDVTDAKGNFTIKGIPENAVRVKFSGIGFRTQVIDSVSLKGNTALGLVKITAVSIEMPEVVVKSLKPMVDYQVDRKVINVDRVPGGSSGTITEALRNSGQVEVDPSTNKITVRGQEVKIQMDGHPFEMSSDVLAHMPATMIDEVEVILSPGAKESAESGEGGAYIVNIITKKNKIDNYNGSVSASTSTNRSNSGTVNLGYKSGKLNLFGMFSGYGGHWYSRNNNERINYLSHENHFLNSYGRGDGNGNLAFSKLGFDYYYDDNNTITFYGNYNRMKYNYNSSDYDDVLNDSLVRKYYYSNNSDNGYTSKTLSLNGFYKRKFETKGKEWTIDLLYTKLDNPTTNGMNVQYNYNPAAPQKQDSRTDVDSKTFIAKTDYVTPFWKGKFETGYSFTTRSRENDYSVENYSYSAQQWLDSMKLSNKFKYTENINAVYVSCTQKFDRFEVKTGLRLENLDTHGQQITTNAGFSENYLNLFPDINIAYKVTPDMPVTFNAFRRVKYPPLYYVNPFKVYLGPNSFRAGNSDLHPFFLNSYSLNFFQMLNFYYVFSTGMFTYANSTVQDSISMGSYINLSKNKTYGIELTLPYYNSPSMPIHLPDFISMLNIRFEYRWVRRYGSFENDDLNDLTKYAGMNANLGMNIWWDVNAGLYFSYSPKIKNPITTDNETKYLVIYMSKGFYNQKLRVSLNINDVLNSQKYGSATYSNTYYSSYYSVQEKSRGISLSVSYMFNDYKERRDRNIDDGRDTDKSKNF